MAERVRCKRCGVEWTYGRYPNFAVCPNCGCGDIFDGYEYVKHEVVCPHCEGTGKVMTSEVREPLYDGCNRSIDAIRISKEILKKEQNKKKT